MDVFFVIVCWATHPFLKPIRVLLPETDARGQKINLGVSENGYPIPSTG